MSDMIKKGMKAVMEKVSSIDIYQITGVNVSEQTYTVKQLNFNKTFTNVEVMSLGLGHGKGQIMLLEENDLVLVGFLMGSQTPYILGSVFNNFMTKKDYKIPIQAGEYFVSGKANNNYIHIKNDGKISFKNYILPLEDGDADDVLKTDGDGNLSWGTGGGGGAVDSVNGETGVVVLDADDIDDTSTTNKFTTAGDISKLAGIESGAEVNDVDTVFGRTGTVVAATGDYTKEQITGLKTTDSPAFTSVVLGGKKLTISASAPSSPATGDIWIDI